MLQLKDAKLTKEIKNYDLTKSDLTGVDFSNLKEDTKEKPLDEDSNEITIKD